MMPEPEGLSAALLLLSEHSGRISVLDEREAAHFRETSGRLASLCELVSGIKDTVNDQPEVLAIMHGLESRVSGLARRVDRIVPDADGTAAFYEPSPAPRWWTLEAEQRERAIEKLRAWVDQV